MARSRGTLRALTRSNPAAMGKQALAHELPLFLRCV